MHTLLIALTRFLTMLLNTYYLVLIEMSPFHMQNTQYEYASLFIILHICHTAPIHAYLFYNDYMFNAVVLFKFFECVAFCRTSHPVKGTLISHNALLSLSLFRLSCPTYGRYWVGLRINVICTNPPELESVTEAWVQCCVEGVLARGARAVLTPSARGLCSK